MATAEQPTTVETRSKHLVEEHLADVAEMTGNSKNWAKSKARLMIQKEDELAWALSRDPQTDMTLVEAHDRAALFGYPRDVRESQSTISRRLRELDRRMLTRPVERLHVDDYGEESDRTAILDEDAYEAYEKYLPGVLDMYRSVLARFLADLRALHIFTDYNSVTPKWCRDRFPELDPDAGLRLHKRADFPDDEPTHLPDDEIEMVPESVHQS